MLAYLRCLRKFPKEFLPLVSFFARIRLRSLNYIYRSGVEWQGQQQFLTLWLTVWKIYTCFLNCKHAHSFARAHTSPLNVARQKHSHLIISNGFCTATLTSYLQYADKHEKIIINTIYNIIKFNYLRHEYENYCACWRMRWQYIYMFMCFMSGFYGFWTRFWHISWGFYCLVSAKFSYEYVCCIERRELSLCTLYIHASMCIHIVLCLPLSISF